MVPGFRQLKFDVLDCLRKEAEGLAPITIDRSYEVYIHGALNPYVYLIESGKVQTNIVDPSGREYALDTFTDGDMFGELCLARVPQIEGARAIEITLLWQVPSARFLARLRADDKLEEFIKFQVMRLSRQQILIADLVFARSKHDVRMALRRYASDNEPRNDTF